MVQDRIAHVGGTDVTAASWGVRVDTRERPAAGYEDQEHTLLLFARVKNVMVRPVDPVSNVARVRSVLLLLAFAAHAVCFPFKVAFLNGVEMATGHSLGRAVRLVMAIDCCLSLNTAYVDKQGRVVSARGAIAQHYVRGWFILDVLAMIPIERILSNSVHPWVLVVVDAVLHLPRFLHVVEITHDAWLPLFQDNDRSVFARLIYSRISHLVKILAIVIYIVFGAHHTACILQTLGDDDQPSSASSPLHQYVARLYDALQLLQGQGVTTTTTSQTAFAAISVLAGSVILAIVFGNIGILVSNFNANVTSYQRKMEVVFAIMSKLKLPTPLRDRIHQYYEHLWSEYEALDGEIVGFSNELSEGLKLEVVLFKYMDLITHVSFWREGSSVFLKKLALNLHVRVYLPDDFIIRRGEVGDEFYMINRGICELHIGRDSYECPPFPSAEVEEEVIRDPAWHLPGSTANGKRRASVASQRGDQRGDTSPESRRSLRRGQYFGELALLMNYERTANARAVTYVELCVLKRAALQDIFAKHPMDRAEVIKNILMSTFENNAVKNIECPLRQIVAEALGRDDVDQRVISSSHAALVILSAINAEEEDISIKFGISTSTKRKIATVEVGLGYETAMPTPREKSELTATRRDPAISKVSSTGPTIVDVATRLDRVDIVQNELLSALKALNAELQAAKGIVLGDRH